MWPWSADSAASQHTQAKLSSDDIIAVQSLYGEKTSNSKLFFRLQKMYQVNLLNKFSTTTYNIIDYY